MIPRSNNMNMRNIITLLIAGSDLPRASIIVRSFSNLVTAFKGLNTLNILRVFIKLLYDSTDEKKYW